MLLYTYFVGSIFISNLPNVFSQLFNNNQFRFLMTLPGAQVSGYSGYIFIQLNPIALIDSYLLLEYIDLFSVLALIST